MEHEIEATEDAFRKLVEQCPSAILIDIGGRLVYVNAAAVRLFGAASSSEILGRTQLEFIHSDYHAAVNERTKRLLLGRDSVGAHHEKWFRIDGTEIDVEVLAAPVDWGSQRGIQVTLRDIKTHVTIAARFEALIEATQDAVICIDRQASIVLFNPAAEKIFGYAKAEVLGRKVNLLMAEPYASEHDTYLDHYKSTGEKRAIGRIRTVAGRKKNGHTFPIELSVTEVSAGQETGYCAFMRDISENVKNQRDLVENNRLATVGTMASKLLHELGNPLNGLHLSAQAFVRRIESPGQLPDSELTRRFDRILNEIKRLNSLLSEFRVGSFAWRYDFKPLRLDSVVQEALSLQRAHYLNQGILIEHHVLAELPPVLADSDKLNQVILNLCNNAAEAMPSGGKLTLQVGCDGQHAILEISDTGSGIPQGVDIWAPFVTTKKTGVGLGMVTVREIVAAHHGTIDYTSAPGKGTTFRLTLPLA